MSEEHVRQLADYVGGTIEEMGSLDDGSGFAVMSMPLPEDHWIYGDPDKEGDELTLSDLRKKKEKHGKRQV